MAHFKIESNEQLSLIKEESFKLEREIQVITEKNLIEILNLTFVKSEFRIGAFRIDTLAYDIANKSFVIIEYKRDKNFSVIDQGYAYLSLMLNNKADFILEYNENMQGTLRRGDVDWSQSKVIFISPSFTPYQVEAINFKDLPIELWEVKKFRNKTISFNQIKKPASVESIKTISKQDETIEAVSQEIKVFTEQEHLERSEIEVQELYRKLKDAINNFTDDISLNPRKHFIGFQSNNKSFTDVVLLKRGVKLYLNLKSGELDDPKRIARDVSNVGHWGNGAYEIQIVDDENIEYVLSLIKQSLQKVKNDN